MALLVSVTNVNRTALEVTWALESASRKKTNHMISSGWNCSMDSFLRETLYRYVVGNKKDEMYDKTQSHNSGYVNFWNIVSPMGAVGINLEGKHSMVRELEHVAVLSLHFWLLIISSR